MPIGWLYKKGGTTSKKEILKNRFHDIISSFSFQ